MKLQIATWCGWSLLSLLLFCSQAGAETGVQSESGWHVGGKMNAFYTDDVSVFSTSQRLSLREDPTQPLVQATRQGASGVFEPVAYLTRSFQSGWGNTELTARAQGFVFTDHTEFSHGTYGTQLAHMLPGETIFRMRYHYGPRMLLGNHVESQLEPLGFGIGKEYVTTHFGTAELERKILDTLSIRGLARYGDRSYNDRFSHRDTRFWTLGTHLEWEIRPGVEFIIGYHYERGLAQGIKTPQLGEDISSFTHYVEAELEVRVTDKITVKGGFDFERNTFTSGFPDDDFRGAHEMIYQGEAAVRYQLTEALAFTIGYIHGQRKLSFEEEASKINIVSFGSAFNF
jgi:hypothetical protein